MPDRPSISNAAVEVGSQIIGFIQTRIRLLRSELRENLSSWIVALATAGVAVVFVVTALLFLTVTITTLIAQWLPTPFRWAIASMIVALFSGASGAVLGYYAIQRLRKSPLTANKTLDVLRDDKNWIEGGGKAA